MLKFNRGRTPENEQQCREQVARANRTLEAGLTGRRYIAGEGAGSVSIADMMCWPWVRRFEWHEADPAAFPAVRDWYLRIANRLAVLAKCRCR